MHRKQKDDCERHRAFDPQAPQEQVGEDNDQSVKERVGEVPADRAFETEEAIVPHQPENEDGAPVVAPARPLLPFEGPYVRRHGLSETARVLDQRVAGDLLDVVVDERPLEGIHIDEDRHRGREGHGENVPSRARLGEWARPFAAAGCAARRGA